MLRRDLIHFSLKITPSRQQSKKLCENSGGRPFPPHWIPACAGMTEYHLYRDSTRPKVGIQTAAKKLSLLLLLVVHSALYAQDIVFEGTDFAAWNHPAGLVQIGSEGVAVKRFGTTFNAVANAGEFSSVTIGDYGRLPVRAPSNQAQAGLVADQDHNTYWQPDLDDPLQKWWLEIDLDRAVVAPQNSRDLSPNRGRPSLCVLFAPRQPGHSGRGHDGQAHCV